jgi:integrase
MPRTRLTELGIERLRPPHSGRVEYWDSTLPSFGLRVTDKGAKSWVLMTRDHGRLRRITLGKFPTLSLTEARHAARDTLQRIERGEPAKAAATAERETVAAVVEQWLARDQKDNRTLAEVRRVMMRDVLPGWGRRTIGDIRKADALVLLDDVADRAPIMANRTLAYLRRMFAWCVSRGIINLSPVPGITSPARERSRDRVLSDDELASVWRACDLLGWPFRDLFQLLIATAQRRTEVARMAWSALDLRKRLWTLPRELVKSDRAHDVPLSGLAVEIIERLPHLGDGLLFPAQRHGSAGPVSGFSKVKTKLDRLSGVSNWLPHDMRRTAASNMARLGYSPHVLAAILNHNPSSTQGITAIYNRHKYTDEKRAALEAWSRELERIVSGETAKVVALRNG